MTRLKGEPLTDWTPNSWRNRPALQQPVYPDPDRAEEVETELSALPPLVTTWEVERQMPACKDLAISTAWASSPSMGAGPQQCSLKST